METTPVIISQANVLQEINRAEIDIQISTAKSYPRDEQAALEKVKRYATCDSETASECFYSLPRKDDKGQTKYVEGPSIRFAELLAHCWGNMRIQTRIIGNDGSAITAQAICHDLESNLAVSKEVQRSIKTRSGHTYSSDMQVTTGNAASSTAFRNAVLSVIPKSITKQLMTDIRKKALEVEDFKHVIDNMFKYYTSLGVSEDRILKYLELQSKEEIAKDHIFSLRALANSIKDGSVTVENVFGVNNDHIESINLKKADMKASNVSPTKLP